MGSRPTFSQADLGLRIAQGRRDAGLNQGDLARAAGLERSAVAAVEGGTRIPSATELLALASALGRSIDWFVDESPPSVVSRREDPALGFRSRMLDLEIEQLARDVAFLLEEGVLTTVERQTSPMPSDFTGTELLADNIHRLVQWPPAPILDLQRACEPLGLLAFSIDLTAEGGDAAYVDVGGVGVALVNGALDPGRRRFDLAHELGHHIIGDAYSTDVSMGEASETERLMNAFAAYLLMPRSAVTSLWQERGEASSRLAALEVAVRFQVSWTAACNQLRNLDLISFEERARLVAEDPRPSEHLQIGLQWHEELAAPSVPPTYARQVLSAYSSGRLTADRTVELLRGAVSEHDLPIPEGPTLVQLRGEFDPLS